MCIILQAPVVAGLDDVRAEIGVDDVRAARWLDPSGAHQARVDGTQVVGWASQGFDGLHPELAGCILPDHHRTAYGVATGIPHVDVENPANDETGHGTEVAGVMCSAGLRAHQGVAPGLRLMAWDGVCTVCNWTHWLRHPQLRILQSSVGTDRADDLERTSGLSPRDDLIYVQAAGNGGGDGRASMTQPVRRDLVPVLVVGASDTGFDRVAPYSSRGARDDPASWPDLTAPGCLWTTRPTHASRDAAVAANNLALLTLSGDSTCKLPSVGAFAQEFAQGYTWLMGTSFASPVVAGVLALMFEVHMNMTAQDAWTLITQTAEPFLPTEDTDGDGRISADEFYAQNGWEAGYGRVDAAAAVGAAHYLLLHPDGGTREALGCFVVAQDPDGQTWLNPQNSTCAWPPTGWTSIRVGHGMPRAGDAEVHERATKNASGPSTAIALLALVVLARKRPRQ